MTEKAKINGWLWDFNRKNIFWFFLNHGHFTFFPVDWLFVFLYNLLITSSAQSYPNGSIRITYYIVISIIMSLLHQSFYHCYINHLIWDFSPSNQSLFYSSPVNEIIIKYTWMHTCYIRFYYHFRRCQQNIFRVRESIFPKTYLLIIYR